MNDRVETAAAAPCPQGRGAADQVDTSVSVRQCVGPGFEKRRDYAQRTEELLSGVLRLSPHGTWKTSDLADWTADPFSSRNWQFQHHALRWLSPLRYAIEDGSEEARRLWIETVRSWIEHNPPGASRSSFAWMDMADGLRAQELIFGWPHVESDDDRQTLLSAIRSHGEWLSDEANQSSGNHALHQNIGLFVVSCFLRREDWRDLAVDRMMSLFSSSFDDHGANDEGAVQYHQLNLSWWRRAWDRVEMEGVEVPPGAKERLHMAAEFLAHSIRPDGTMTPIGDTHLRRVKDEGWPELEYVASQAEKGDSPESTVVVAPNGYVFGRSGWGSDPESFGRQSHYSIRHGSVHTHHAHEDRGAVTFYSGGQDWATDPGSYIYEPKDPLRRYLKSREGHNVLVIEDCAYSPDAAVTLQESRISAEVHDFVLSDHNYEGVSLRRRVVYLVRLDLLIVIDSYEAEKPVVAKQLWHVDAGIKPRFRDGAVEMQERSGKRLSLNWLGQWSSPSVKYAEEGSPTGWVSRAWAEKVAAAVVSTETTGRRGVCAAVLGTSTEDPWAVETSRLRAEDCWMRIVRFGQVWHITIDAAGAAASLDEIRTKHLHDAVRAADLG